MPNKNYLLILSLIHIASPLYGLANSGYEEHQTSEETELVHSLSQLNPMDHDYRLKRDAAVVAFGCNTIPFYDYKTRSKCYTSGLFEVTNGVNFDRLILDTCNYVSKSITTKTFSDCIENISEKMNYEPLRQVYKHCESMRNFAIWEKPSCYKNSITELESAEEKLPKMLRFEVRVTNEQISEKTQVKEIEIQQHIPPRSDVDQRKLTALTAACKSLNRPSPVKISYNKTKDRYTTIDNISTDSEFREMHCYFDGLKALVKGTTVPGVILSACEFRLFGNDGILPDPRNFRDYKQLCMESGILATEEANLTGPLDECRAQVLRGPRDLLLGLHPLGARNCTEHLLSAMDAAQKAIQLQEEITREQKTSKSGKISNWEGVRPENQTSVTETLLNEATKSPISQKVK